MKQSLVHSIRAISVFALVAMAACADSSSGRLTGTDTTSGTNNTSNSGTTQNSTVPASMAVVDGDAQTGPAGSALAKAPQVIVKNAAGAGLAGVSVTFMVTSGGGAVNVTTATTNSSGIASAGAWTLGTVAGTNSLVATSGSLSPVTFSATGTATAANSYNITIRWLGTATASQQLAVSNAVAKWQSVITKDLADIPLNAAKDACFPGQPAVNERIDDIVIYVEFVEIDGASNVLGEAGPCYIRSDNQLPVLGHLKLDAADLALMERSGTMNDVVLHEMGHILGIGTLWPDKGLLQGGGTADPRFMGAGATAAYRGLGSLDTSVPVENSGGDGTRDGHWRESTFGNELMTGYISSANNPMSAMTIASLNDLGYGVNSSAAASYSLSRTSSSVVAGIELDGHEGLKKPKYKVDHSGNKTKIDL